MPDAPIAAPVAPVTAVASPAGADQLASLSAADRATWRLTGDLPGEKKTEPTPDPPSPNADSTPAVPAEPGARTGAEQLAASEPAKPKTEDRFQTLLRERHEATERATRLERELADLRAAAPKPDAPKASSTTPPPSLADTVAAPDLSKPALSDVAFFAAYPEASLGDFNRYVTRHEMGLATRQTQAQAARQTREQAARAAMAPAEKADAAFMSKQSPDVVALTPIDFLAPGQTVTAANVVAQEMFVSPALPQLMQHFTDHPEELARLKTLPPLAIAREIGRLEAKVVSAPAPRPQTVSTAPPPPTTLGTKVVTQADEVESAVAAGDFRRYREAQNRREMTH